MDPELYTCLNCQEEFPASYGIFCMKTTPFYPLTNCDLTVHELIQLAQTYDARTPNVEERISYELRYDDAANPPHRQELCSVLSSKLRLDAPPKDQQHFICSGPMTNKCINALVKTQLTEKIRLDVDEAQHTFTGYVRCCGNDVPGHVACDSHYDNADLLQHLDRPRRMLLQNVLEEYQRILQVREQNRAVLVPARPRPQKSEHETMVDMVYDQATLLLVPECPHCHAKFIDWDNCYSITCKNCNKDFCGVCLSFYGTSRETHDHIRTGCKKHTDWKVNNPQCNYYGSDPIHSPLLYIRVQTNQASWVYDRRAMYPDDPHLEAPTLLEKLHSYLASAPVRVRHDVIQRMIVENEKDIRYANKEFRVTDMYGTVLPQHKLISKSVILVPSRYVYRCYELGANITSLFTDGFFPSSLFYFMKPIVFYELMYEWPTYIQVRPKDQMEELLLARFNMTRFSMDEIDVNDFDRDQDEEDDDLIHPTQLTVQLPFREYTKGNSYQNVLVYLFIEMLRSCQAVVAGGFVLNAASLDSLDVKQRRSEKQDLDMYIHLRNAKSCLLRLVELGWKIVDSHITPAYDQSFIRRNKILSRISLVDRRSRKNHVNSAFLPNIDLMLLPDEVEIESVVTNFDLTFCQVWYDGKTIRATHWDDIRLKRGTLQPEYRSSYQRGNLFLISRIKKYRNRGYDVDTVVEIDPHLTQIIEEIEEGNQRYRSLLSSIPIAQRRNNILFKENSRALFQLYAMLKQYNRKLIVFNTDEWVITKLYETLVKKAGIAQRRSIYSVNSIMNYLTIDVYTNHALYPLTYERFKEVAIPLYRLCKIRNMEDYTFSSIIPDAFHHIVKNDLINNTQFKDAFWSFIHRTNPEEYVLIRHDLLPDDYEGEHDEDIEQYGRKKKSQVKRRKYRYSPLKKGKARSVKKRRGQKRSVKKPIVRK